MILVDAFLLMHRYNYSLTDLCTRDGRPSGMEYGFLKCLEALRRYFKGELILCWEGRNNFRFSIYPEYKANRKGGSSNKIGKDRIQGFKNLCSMVAENAEHDSLEADDVIASLCDKYPKTIIYSHDKDLLQLITKTVNVVVNFQHRMNPRTIEAIEDRYNGLRPDQLPMFFAFAGDKVDNVIGCHRIRTPILMSAIRLGYSPHDILNYELWSGGEIDRLEEFLEAGKYEQNLELVTLRKIDVTVQKRQWNEKAIGEWLEDMEFRTLKLCRQCGIETTIDPDDEF